jgi:uncharacterized Fe-S center protein
VALDQASVDRVNLQNVAGGSCLKDSERQSGDIFRSVYPKIDWSIQLKHAEKIGIGSRKYDLVTI